MLKNDTGAQESPQLHIHRLFPRKNGLEVDRCKRIFKGANELKKCTENEQNKYGRMKRLLRHHKSEANWRPSKKKFFSKDIYRLMRRRVGESKRIEFLRNVNKEKSINRWWWMGNGSRKKMGVDGGGK